MHTRLKLLRKKLGLKQRELAERLCVTVGLVGNWESGVNEIPKTRVYQICKEFNVREDWLRTGNGEIFEPQPDVADRATAEENFIVSIFERLTPEQQNRILNALRRFVNASPKEQGGSVFISDSQNVIGQFFNNNN